mmetsp:Transcript_15523/g.46538  ORF Transcript_15523/g.46538 Transcript_15523/m.46538 type:complete len:192 (-) Transcript_15523:193-768(-)
MRRSSTLQPLLHAERHRRSRQPQRRLRRRLGQARLREAVQDPKGRHDLQALDDAPADVVERAAEASPDADGPRDLSDHIQRGVAATRFGSRAARQTRAAPPTSPPADASTRKNSSTPNPSAEMSHDRETTVSVASPRRATAGARAFQTAGPAPRASSSNPRSSTTPSISRPSNSYVARVGGGTNRVSYDAG